MVIPRGSLAMLDTNVLLSAVNTLRVEHDTSRFIFSRAYEKAIHLGTCGQILREYLVVATRPIAVNGLGQNITDALKNVSWFRKRLIYFEETEAVHSNLLSIAESRCITGKHIHDANIVAVMYNYGIYYLITSNPKDFSVFPNITTLLPGEV